MGGEVSNQKAKNLGKKGYGLMGNIFFKVVRKIEKKYKNNRILVN